MIPTQSTLRQLTSGGSEFRACESLGFNPTTRRVHAMLSSRNDGSDIRSQRPTSGGVATSVRDAHTRLTDLARATRQQPRHLYRFVSGSTGHGSRTGRYSPGQSAYASSGLSVSFAADAPYFAATSLTG